MGDQNLAADDIDAGDDFRDRMLDLNSGIDLDEIEFASILVDEKLDGRGVVEMNGFADGQGGLEDSLAKIGV